MPLAAKLTRRALLSSVSAAILAAQMPAPAQARPPFARGGKGAAGPTQVTTFTIVETDNAASSGFKRVGLVFRDGDVPAGSRVKIQRGGVDVPAQFDNRSSWWVSGCLQFCTACIRDDDFTAGESRTYSVQVLSGAFDNSSGLSLTSARSGTDFKVAFTSLSGSTTGSQADHTASLNTHAGVGTRVTQYEKGPVCDSWMIWGMAAASGIDHAHLKTISYFSAWKNASGAVVAREIAAVVSQDWWSVAGKEKLSYIATLQDGAASIQTYGGALNSSGVRAALVEHPYGSQWATVRLTDDNQHGTRHWVGAARPTLLYKPNRTYWIATGLVPPLDLSPAYVMRTDYTTGTNNDDGGPIYQPYIYQPCSAQGHRPGIDGNGNYAGRGIIPDMDCIAFIKQTAVDVRTMRVNAFAGLGLPQHRRSNNQRTRSGESADTANTLCSLILRDERATSTPSSFYDFTADGLPAPVHAYAGGGAGYTDGFTAPSGGYGVGSSTWGPSPTATHAVPYSYFAYLLEGERYFLEATLDLGINVIQQLTGAQGAEATLAFYHNNVALYPGAPSAKWSGISFHLTYTNPGSTRGMGWAANMLAGMVIVPDDDVHYRYVKQVLALHAKWAKMSFDLIPASGVGTWAPGVGAVSLWMDNFIGLCFYTAYDRSKDPNWLPVAEFTALQPIIWGEINRTGHANSYREIHRPSHNTNWNATTNDWFQDGGYELITATSIDGATDQINAQTRSKLTWTEGDEVWPSDNDVNLLPKTIPTELSVTKYYVRNPNGNASFQLAATPGGTVIDFATYSTVTAFGVRCQSAATPGNEENVSVPDSYGPIARAMVVMAKRHNHARATNTVMSRFETYYAGVDWITGGAGKSWATWNLSPTV